MAAQLELFKDLDLVHPLYGFPVGTRIRMVVDPGVAPADNKNGRVDLGHYMTPGWKWESLLHFDIRYARFKNEKQVVISFSKDCAWNYSPEQIPSSFPFVPGQRYSLEFCHVEQNLVKVWGVKPNPNVVQIFVDGKEFCQYKAPYHDLSRANFLSISGNVMPLVNLLQVEPNPYKMIFDTGVTVTSNDYKIPYMQYISGLTPGKKITVRAVPTRGEGNLQWWVELNVLRHNQAQIAGCPLSVLALLDREPTQLLLRTSKMFCTSAEGHMEQKYFNCPFKIGQLHTMEIVGQKDNTVQVNVDGQAVGSIKVDHCDLRNVNAISVNRHVQLKSLSVRPEMYFGNAEFITGGGIFRPHQRNNLPYIRMVHNYAAGMNQRVTIVATPHAGARCVQISFVYYRTRSHIKELLQMELNFSTKKLNITRLGVEKPAATFQFEGGKEFKLEVVLDGGNPTQFIVDGTQVPNPHNANIDDYISFVTVNGDLQLTKFSVDPEPAKQVTEKGQRVVVTPANGKAFLSFWDSSSSLYQGGYFHYLSGFGRGKRIVLDVAMAKDLQAYVIELVSMENRIGPGFRLYKPFVFVVDFQNRKVYLCSRTEVEETDNTMFEYLSDRFHRQEVRQAFPFFYEQRMEIVLTSSEHNEVQVHVNKQHFGTLEVRNFDMRLVNMLVVGYYFKLYSVSIEPEVDSNDLSTGIQVSSFDEIENPVTSGSIFKDLDQAVHPLAGFPVGSKVTAVVQWSPSALHCRFDLAHYATGWRFESLMHLNFRHDGNVIGTIYDRSVAEDWIKFEPALTYTRGQKFKLEMVHAEDNVLKLTVDDKFTAQYKSPKDLKKSNFLLVGADDGCVVHSLVVEPNPYKQSSLGNELSIVPSEFKIPFVQYTSGLTPGKRIRATVVPTEGSTKYFWVDLLVLRNCALDYYTYMNCALEIWAGLNTDPKQTILELDTYDMNSSSYKKRAKFPFPFVYGQKYVLEVVARKRNVVQVLIDGAPVGDIVVEGVNLRCVNAICMNYDLKLESFAIQRELPQYQPFERELSGGMVPPTRFRIFGVMPIQGYFFVRLYNTDKAANPDDWVMSFAVNVYKDRKFIDRWWLGKPEVKEQIATGAQVPFEVGKPFALDVIAANDQIIFNVDGKQFNTVAASNEDLRKVGKLRIYEAVHLYDVETAGQYHRISDWGNPPFWEIIK